MIMYKESKLRVEAIPKPYLRSYRSVLNYVQDPLLSLHSSVRSTDERYVLLRTKYALELLTEIP